METGIALHRMTCRGAILRQNVETRSLSARKHVIKSDDAIPSLRSHAYTRSIQMAVRRPDPARQGL